MSSSHAAGYSFFYVAALCTVYMFIGPSLIILNKHILSDLVFPYPIFLSALGVFVTAMFSQAQVYFGYTKLTKSSGVVDSRFYIQKILPIGLGHAGTLAFGNIAYLFLNVGTIQMLKSFTPVIIFLTSVVYYNLAFFNSGSSNSAVERADLGTLVSLLVICIGIAVTCTSTIDLSVVGLVVMFLAELMEALRLIITQHLLQNLKFDVSETQYHISPASAFWLFVCSCIFEFRKMYINNAFSIIFANFFTFLFASTLGLGINFLSNYVMQATSALTMKVLGTLRSILTIFLGVLFFGEAITSQEMMGYSIALVGFFLYNAAKAGALDRIISSFVPSSSTPTIISHNSLSSPSKPLSSTSLNQNFREEEESRPLILPSSSLDRSIESTIEMKSSEVEFTSDIAGLNIGLNSRSSSISNSSNSGGQLSLSPAVGSSVKRFAYKV